MSVGIRRIAAIAIVTIGALLESPGRAADLSIKPGDQLVRVSIRDERARRALEAMDLDVWSHDAGMGPVDVHVSPAQREALRPAGLNFETLNADLHAAFLAERPPAAPEGGYFNAYHPWSETIDYLNGLALQRPDLATMVHIGDSLEGRPIWAIRITGPNYTPDRPALLFHGTIHAREWITATVIPYLATHLLTQYDTDPDVATLVNGVEWWLIPVLNPDGYVYSWIDASTRLWRKNRRLNADGSQGVDLNRNFGYQWGGLGSSGIPSSEIYRGVAPFSEPEAQILRDFVLAHPSIRAHLDVHSYGQMIMWPWGYTMDLCPDDAIFRDLGLDLRQAIFDVHGRDYAAGPIYTTIYPVSGGTVDWFHGDRGVWSYTYEVRDTGQFGFLLPPDQILPTNEELLPSLLMIADWVAQPLLFHFPQGVPDQVQAHAYTNVDVRVVDIGGQLDLSTPAVFFRLDPGASFIQSPVTPLGADLFQATLPPTDCPQTLEFYFQAAATTGAVVTAPPQGAAQPFVALPTDTVFIDAFETQQGWQVGAPGDNASSGVWLRDDPIGTLSQPEDDHTPAGTLCFFTGQTDPLGGQPDNVDNGRTTLTSPTWAIPAAGEARIGYWRWYANHLGPGAHEDVFQVDVSGNDGATWVNVETVGPLGPETVGGWHYHEFRLADFVPPTTQVRLRFVASDFGAPSIVEAAIDDLRVFRVNCGAPGCPTFLGDMSGDGAVDGRDIAGFAAAMVEEPHFQPCADLALPIGDTLDAADLAAFVGLLVAP